MNELPPGVFAALAASGTTGIVATVDPEGRPHTAPFGSLWAASPQLLRFGCDRTHATFANIERDGRVAVSVIAPPDIAITVFGAATIVREAMESLPSDAVIEVGIEEIKDDMLLGATIDSGVRYSVPADVRAFIETYMAEVRV